MNPDTKKKLIIVGSVGLLIIAGIFIKRKIDERRFKPVDRQIIINTLKKLKKINYGLFRKVCGYSVKIAAQMKINQIDIQMIKNYLQSAESPLKINELIQKNLNQACDAFKISQDDFNQSVEYYINEKKDLEIQNMIEQSKRDYETALGGKLPEIKVSIPADLTVDKLIDIHKKLTLKKYFVLISTYRKMRGKTQQQLQKDSELNKSLPNLQQQQQQILIEEGLGINDDPPSAVYLTALTNNRNNPKLKQAVNKSESNYLKIFRKYQPKMQQNKATNEDLDELQDELIYSDAI